VVEVNPGKLAFFVNASLGKKQLILAALAGITPVVLIFAVSTTSWLSAKVALKPAPIPPAPASLSPWSQPKPAMMLLTGLGTFALTWLGLQLLISQIKRSLDDLQSQFDHLSEGNFNAKATIYSEDEFGQLANRFNQMAQVVATITTLAQGRAAETERERKNLQRQVIRLLDDVEGAARGDLTVEAEVSADVLGAVADAFNLTIQNLREIVRQVKKAAKQVNQASTNSESFARNQSSDALRMAEELAVTLNSVQMMTDSIQRVAENAREAEEVARTSSITALKGGDSVERTVAGILQIRDTVSETARKVKRLAEASQEISKIVAVVSQIASRTNLLALNASIQAARAGDAGRGFAVVADEVRQLAYRSAKSLKEIEQIVLQIQSETGSVMMAMEEGIQQVIDVTERSEQAKKSLEDIIQVSNRIDTLVRSITADTVKQRENSLNVAQVMQSVELTAQETSQESQQVAGSLQKLVSISRELLSSVERFKIDSEDN
jgi:twitching motility protein PilJ